METKLTKKRQAILNILKNKKVALSAAEVYKLISNIDLATVYRGLEYLTSKKIIKKLQLGMNEAKFEYQHEPHHHAMCNQCKKVIHFTAPDKEIIKLLKLEDFDIDDLEIIVRGRHANRQ